MDIAAMSIDMSLAKTQNAVGIAMTKKAMDLQQTEAAAMVEMLASVPTASPSFGHSLDILA
ncbi:MAG: putative motility protein [Anaerotruncus sp.]|jgi:hypothetical protein|nr:putative motility protein [Anaerotruncus sp.]